jgi:hypothetical protein
MSNHDVIWAAVFSFFGGMFLHLSVFPNFSLRSVMAGIATFLIVSSLTRFQR